MATSAQVQKSQRRKKMHAVEAFGGECQLCGYSKCLNALEFHHTEGKLESPSYVIMRWAWERAKQELDKCILVCANCHRELHYLKLDVDLKSLRLPWLTVACPCCKRQFDTKSHEQKFCSVACAKFGNRKVRRPTRKQLQALIATTPMTQLGKMFGVSDNAVRKWARNYKLL